MKTEKENIEFTYLTQPPKRYTFEQPKLKQWIERNCIGKVLNLFAGNTKLNVNEVRVDIDKNALADYYMDGYEFVNMATKKHFKFDTIVLDPPYNLRKSREKYDGRFIGSFTKIKNILPQILNKTALLLLWVMILLVCQKVVVLKRLLSALYAITETITILYA